MTFGTVVVRATEGTRSRVGSAEAILRTEFTLRAVSDTGAGVEASSIHTRLPFRARFRADALGGRLTHARDTGEARATVLVTGADVHTRVIHADTSGTTLIVELTGVIDGPAGALDADFTVGTIRRI